MGLKPRNVFSSSSLGEEGVERVIAGTNGLVRRHLAVGLDPVFQAVEIKRVFRRLEVAWSLLGSFNKWHSNN